MPKQVCGARLATFAAAVVLGTGLAGCGGIDGIELQGGVFDALGVSSSNKPATKNVKVAARPGLVLPPSEQALPPPSDGASVAAAAPDGQSWPVDPEQRKVLANTQLDKQHKDFCERALTDARMRGEDGVVMGPKGNCQPGLFGNLAEALEGKKSE